VKRLATATAVIALIGTSALAADMAVKSPAPAPAPVYNWTGWYVGVNAGASMGNANTNFNVSPFFVGKTAVGGFGGSNREYPSGFIGGGQIGYNWQYSPLIVVGLEADIQGALERDSQTLTNPFSVTPLATLALPTITGTSVVNYTTKIDWFGTVRGRIGYVWGNGEVLTYATGGLAYGKVDLEGTGTISGTSTINAVVTPFSGGGSFGHSAVNTGWVAGYGTEGRIDFWGARNWTWRVESLYMDFGHLSNTGAGGQVATNTHFTDWILRGGLNYQFH
jgi:outer membrane immunogenic protein